MMRYMVAFNDSNGYVHKAYFDSLSSANMVYQSMKGQGRDAGLYKLDYTHKLGAVVELQQEKLVTQRS